MVRIFWLAIGTLLLLWLLRTAGLFGGQTAVVVDWVLGTACSLVCPVSFFLIFFAPGLVREITGEIDIAWQRFHTRRRDIDNLKQKINHLDKPHHMLQLGSLYLRQGRYAAARRWLTDAVEKDPGLLDARYKLGICQYKTGHYTQAADLFERVNQEKPDYDYGQAYLRLAQTHVKLGHPERADEIFATLLKYYPGQPQGSYDYALLQAARGDRTAARDLMRGLISSVRHSPGFQRRRYRHLVLKAHWWLLRHPARD